MIFKRLTYWRILIFAVSQFKVSCSWIQYSGSACSETRTSNPSIPSLTLYQLSHCPPHANSSVSCADAIYVSGGGGGGGVQVHLTKKMLTFFFQSSTYFYRSPMVTIQRKRSSSGSAHKCVHCLVKYLLTSTKRCYLSDQFQFLNMK